MNFFKSLRSAGKYLCVLLAGASIALGGGTVNPGGGGGAATNLDQWAVYPAARAVDMSAFGMTNVYGIAAGTNGVIYFYGNLIPGYSNMYDMGSSSRPLHRIYVASNSVMIDNYPLSASAAGLAFNNYLIIATNGVMGTSYWARLAGTSYWANVSGTAGTSYYAVVAGSALANGGTSYYATAAGTAGTSVYATAAGTSYYATAAGTAGTSVYATAAGTAGTSVYANAAGTSYYATAAGTAGTSYYATVAGSASSASTAGSATNLVGPLSTVQGILQVSSNIVGTIPYAQDIGSTNVPFRNVIASNVTLTALSIGTNASISGTVLASAFTVGNITDTGTNVTSAGTSTDFELFTTRASVNVLRGSLFNTGTNVFSKNVTLTFYAASDYKGSNAYWRANMALVASPLTVSNALGVSTAVVADATGFTTNDLVYFQLTGERARIASNTADTLFFEDPLILNHGVGEGVSRIAEFGGFYVWNRAGLTNMYGRLTTTNTLSAVNKVELLYRE